MGRLPRFLGKSTLWDVWPLRPFLALAGIIPVYRAVDPSSGAGGTRRATGNRSSFEACHRVLARQGMVALFPEGTTHDIPRLDEIRTGAARIALGARAAGVRDLLILPMGLGFIALFTGLLTGPRREERV